MGHSLPRSSPLATAGLPRAVPERMSSRAALAAAAAPMPYGTTCVAPSRSRGPSHSCRGRRCRRDCLVSSWAIAPCIRGRCWLAVFIYTCHTTSSVSVWLRTAVVDASCMSALVRPRSLAFAVGSWLVLLSTPCFAELTSIMVDARPSASSSFHLPALPPLYIIHFGARVLGGSAWRLKCGRCHVLQLR